MIENKNICTFCNFDEVRTATEGSACGCEGGKKLNKTKTYMTKYCSLVKLN